MTHFLLIILFTVSLLLSAFFVCLAVVRNRPRYRHYESPQSISTPLGTYRRRKVRTDVRLEDGVELARMRDYMARYPVWKSGDESAGTVKCEVRRE